MFNFLSRNNIVIRLGGIAQRIRVTGPNGVLSLLFSLHLVIVIAIFFPLLYCYYSRAHTHFYEILADLGFLVSQAKS